MPLFSHNKNNANDGTRNTNNENNNTSSGLTGRENNGNYPNPSDPSYDNNTMSGGGGGPQSGGMLSERGTGVNQGYDNQTGNEVDGSRRGEVPTSDQQQQHHQHHHHGPGTTNTGAGVGTGTGTGTGGSGGFIAQSHADRLGRDAEVRRQEKGFGNGGGGNGGGRKTEEYNAMGFDSPPSNPSNTNPSNNANYGSGGGTGNTGSGNVVHNSLSLKEQAEQKIHESEAIKKQAGEVGKAEELEKAALAARQRAVEHGAHPLHGQPGGIDGRGGQA